MTTPDTAAVRAWAKDNGMTVADRGRLPADLHAAYLAANGGSAAAGPAKPSKAAKAAPKRKATAKATSGTRKPAGTTVAVDEPAEVTVAAPAKKTTQRKAAGRTPAKPSGASASGSRRASAAKTAATKTGATKPRAKAATPEPVRDEDAFAAVEQETTEYVTPEVDASAAEPTPSPDSSPEVARLIALEVQLSALAGRVAALEQSHSAPPPKQSRFRRRG